MAKKKNSFNKKTDEDSGNLFNSATTNSASGNQDNSAQANSAVDALAIGEQSMPLHEIAQSRYLNYALSVITSRALPDVRDGLKPVQRRIFYTMHQSRITHESKHRKCAKVVGDVMGNYHPHGDSAIYESLVRMAQPFSLRMPLIDGSGNFGSLDGDSAAAMRYTECRLAPIAGQLLDDITKGTVDFRPNYDGTKEEPVVLPSRVPNLLVNGATGIAVGMATNMPPHNLREVCNALLKLLDNPELKTYQLVANDAIQGPDFPTGGQMLSTRDQLREIYKAGQGTIKLRGSWELEKGKGQRAKKKIYITSVPYMVNKAQLVERIADIVLSRKMPLLLDVKDVSTDDVRIELVIKKSADEQKVLAYLYKHTPLQTNFSVNMTCLVPTENPMVGRPQRSDLREILWHFLIFRLEVVTRRLENELEALQKRIHILEGFAFAFDILDDLIKIIRKSEGKADAAKQILKKYGVDTYGKGGLDELQVEAILELKLYRLARLEVQVIEQELADKRKRAEAIQKLLNENTEDQEGNPITSAGRWGIVGTEIKTLIETYGKADKRRTTIEDVQDEPEFSEEDFIVAEDNHVLVTTDGWIKRQKQIADPEKSRLREGDDVLACQPGSTRAVMVFFSNFGTAYSCHITDIPATTGYGEPIQKLFKLKDQERIIAAYSLDKRAIGPIFEDEKHPDQPPAVHALAATSDGYALRFSLSAFAEPSTKNGRKYARPTKGKQVIAVEAIEGEETVLTATANARAILCPAQEIKYLSGAGKGVQLIKLDKTDSLLAMRTALDSRDTLIVKTSRGGEQRINTAKYKVVSRGGKGHEIIKRGKISEVVRESINTPIDLGS